jgi:hypothetical protein
MASTLFILTGDPRRDNRVAEAVRIAAGIGVWKRNTLAIYLRDAAVLALSPDAGDWLDGDAFVRYLPLLQQAAHPVYVQKENRWLHELGEPSVPFLAVSDSQLANLMLEFQCITRF